MMLQAGGKVKSSTPRAARFLRIESVPRLCRRPIYENMMLIISA
jgi:hypothetical protein